MNKKLFLAIFSMLIPASSSAAITGYETTVARQQTTVDSLSAPGQVIGPYEPDGLSSGVMYYEQPSLWFVDGSGDIEYMPEPAVKVDVDIVLNDSPLISPAVEVKSVVKKKKKRVRRPVQRDCVSN